MSKTFATVSFIIFHVLCGISQSCFNSPDDIKHKESVEYILNRITYELTRIFDERSQMNYVYSGYSLMSAITPMISMLEEKPRHQIEECIGITLQGLQAFMNTRNEDSTFNEATKIWLDKTIHVNTNKVSEAMNGLLEVVDMGGNPNDAESHINEWVANKTHGVIKDLLPRGVVNSQTKLLITNAISFRGSWKIPFDKTLTQNRAFHVNAHETIHVSTMANTVTTNYYRGDTLGEMVELPYKGDKYSMFIILPKTPSSINGDLVTKAIGKMQKMKVKILLPKFKMASSFNMKAYLTSMGLQRLFSKVSALDEDVNFTDILHKVSVTVDEEGTVASGGTAVLTGRMMIPYFRVDKPFHFFIRNIHTNVIIFAGRVSKPQW